MKLSLPDVTLVAVDCAAHELTRLALEECLARADFGSVMVFSDKSILPGSEWHYFEGQGVKDATEAYWYDVPKYASTKHILYVQYDSWIIDADAWNPDFLNYDYIGAPWWYHDENNVGNGGFSLRSTKLMQYVGARPADYPCHPPEDDALCRRHGPALKKQGFKFAPTDVAVRFSFERVRGVDMTNKPIPVFGFHGTFNWPLVLTDEQIEERVAVAPKFFFDHVHYQQMREAQKQRRSPL